MEIMKFHLTIVFVLISILEGVVSEDPSPAQLYWKTKLLNTPIPNVIQDFLPEANPFAQRGPELFDTIRRRRLKGRAFLSNNDASDEEPAAEQSAQDGSYFFTASDGGMKASNFFTASDGGFIARNFFTASDGGLKTRTLFKTGDGGLKAQTFFVASDGGLKALTFLPKNITKYNQLPAGTHADIFFFEHQLRPGSKVREQFTDTSSTAKFLPSQVAERVPISSRFLPKILSLLSVCPTSHFADIMAESTTDCERASSEEPCLASLEQIVDYTINHIGSQNVVAKTTHVEHHDKAEQDYTIMGKPEIFKGNKTVACHAKDFAYPVFMCHSSSTTRAYTVQLVGTNGNHVSAVVACHTNTEKWNPNHLSFRMLHVKPGTVPICHFLPVDHILFRSVI